MFFNHRYRTPTVLQMEAAECGAAALGILLAYYGRYVSLEELREKCGVSRDGSKASHILKAARDYGLQGQGAQVETLSALKKLPRPFIAFWEFNHFIVIEDWHRDKFYINDPATGPRIVNWDEFNRAFTGIVLLLKPDAKFKRGGKPPSLGKSLWQRLQGSRHAILFAFLASLALVIPGIVIPGFSKIFIDDILIRQFDQWLWPLLIGMLLTALMRGALTWLQQIHLLRIQAKLFVSASARFIWHVLHLPVSFFGQRLAGDVNARVAGNDRVAQLLSTSLTANAVNLIATIFYFFVMLLFDVELSYIVLAVTLMNLCVLRYVSRYIGDMSRRYLQERGKLTGIEMHGLRSIETLKATASEEEFFNQWADQHAKTMVSQQAIHVYENVLTVLPHLLFSLMMITLLGLGAWKIMQGQLTVGSLVALQSLAVSFNAPLTGLLSFGGQLQEIRGDLARLDDVLQHPIDKGRAYPAVDSRDHAIVFDKVSFGYSAFDAPLLENFSLTITRGKRVAIVGNSGSGKTTIARLVCGLYTPWSGDIKRAQETLALVDQDIFLFEGTLRDNLTLWDHSIANSDIRQAMQDAMIDNSMGVFSECGLQKITEEGHNLSAGQRQRIELARALVTQPQLLILDEATSALDPLVEKQIIDNLKQRQCTQLIIAHRLSTIRDCDEIVVLQQGKIAERGTHDALLAQHGVYAQLIAH